MCYNCFMGASNSQTLSREAEANKSTHKELTDEYRQTFQKCSGDAQFLKSLLCEDADFGANLQGFFPEVTKSYEAFVEMTEFLLKEGVKGHFTEYVKKNAHGTSVL